MAEIQTDVDDEFAAMQAVFSALKPLSEEGAQQRVMDYVANRLGLSIPRAAKGSANQHTVIEDESTEENEDTSVHAPGDLASFGTFAELCDAAQPKTQADKALVGGYWLQVCQGGESFDGFAINKELKNLGEGIANITSALETLKAQKPALALQLKKSGKARQARKTFKVTVAGIKAVEAMIRG
ncbi:hypothetical protein [Sphingomonas fuzhouensis]|uniref:hypothetical protein n=1 Tax=Sphingomonas fuzhouensis TaxID=3106033 RepID=UPI002AFF4B95|nr:hypothetical protein [Sphingomonas sp. SGZ-02]